MFKKLPPIIQEIYEIFLCFISILFLNYIVQNFLYFISEENPQVIDNIENILVNNNILEDRLCCSYNRGKYTFPLFHNKYMPFKNNYPMVNSSVIIDITEKYYFKICFSDLVKEEIIKNFNLEEYIKFLQY